MADKEEVVADKIDAGDTLISPSGCSCGKGSCDCGCKDTEDTLTSQSGCSCGCGCKENCDCGCKEGRDCDCKGNCSSS